MPTVFHQPWWLNAATGGDYGEAVVSMAGRRLGSFPYVVSPVLAGHRLCTMPALTHFLGPGIDDGEGAACNRVLRRAQITRDLLRQIPRTSGFWQKMHRGIHDTLPFQEQGYATTVQFTFEVKPDSADALWRNMRDKTRNVIRRAGEQYGVADMPDATQFAAMYVDNLTRNGERCRHDPRLIIRMCQAAAEHGQGRIIAAQPQSGGPAAAIFYVWDAQAAYYLLSTRAPGAANGAVSLLLWHAMRDIAGRGLVFDFEGVITSGSALFFTGFGGQVVPRYVVSRFTRGHRIAGRLSNPLRRAAAETYL